MQQIFPPKKDTQRGSILVQTPLSPRSQTSRKSSLMNRQSFEQQELYSSRRIGFNLKDPQKVEEMIKIRQQRLPRKEAAKDGEKDLREISKAYDVLKNALPEINNNYGVIKDQELLQFYKQQIVINQNPRKNFFEFNTYFYKNYQANNNGPCTTLPQLLIKKVESFYNQYFINRELKQIEFLCIKQIRITYQRSMKANLESKKIYLACIFLYGYLIFCFCYLFY